MRINQKIFRGVDRICWLCVLIELMSDVVKEKSLQNAPFILSGMNSLYSLDILKPYRLPIFNTRQIVDEFITKSSIRKGINFYNDHHYLNHTQGVYKIDAEDLTFTRIDFLEDTLITQAKAILNQPLDYHKHSKKVANPSQQMSVILGDKNISYPIPIEPINVALNSRKIHQIKRSYQGKITIYLDELKKLAQEMDKREKQVPERKQENWLKRLNFDLMTTEIGDKLQITNKIELEGIKHLLGLPGSGKTTILMLIAIWLGNHGYKALFLFPSIEVARQYYTQLKFHEIKVGMLVGNSDETRRRHGNNLAESIAISSENNGFANTIEGAELFSLNCILPAFTKQDTSFWKFGEAPCSNILQGKTKTGKPQENLCPLWTMCGRNTAPRDLINANIWVGHVLSMDTDIPPHAIDEQIRYFELIARTFDVVVFDEADMVQSLLDKYGVATLNISGSEKSIHSKIFEAINNRFAKGENYYLFDRDVQNYTRDLSEFEGHNYTLIHTLQNLSLSHIGKRYEHQLLTIWQLISDLLNGLEKDDLNYEELSENELLERQNKINAKVSFWRESSYQAFDDRIGANSQEWKYVDSASKSLGIEREILSQKFNKLSLYFRQYLAENSAIKRDKIVKNITELFLTICFINESKPAGSEEVIKLLISITFMILGYRKIVLGTRRMIAEGLIKESIINPTPSSILRRIIPENLLGSFSGVKYSFSKANSPRANAKNVELSYLTLMGTPRMLMHYFHELFKPENQEKNPAVLMTSATSFLEFSSAYHLQIKPNYLLKPQKKQHSTNSEYTFLPLSDQERGGIPLRYSGAGELRNRNLEKMIDQLLKDGDNSYIYKQRNKLDTNNNIKRKVALVVNSYEQARNLKKYINHNYPEIGKKTKALVKFLYEGDSNKDYLTPAQCPLFGDDENCDILIFPMLAIGRGVNIVFTKGERKLDASIGSIYFLTRPHPTIDDLQLLYSLAGEATQNFNRLILNKNNDLNSLIKQWELAKKDIRKKVDRLLKEPFMASRLNPSLFTAFTANQMVDILQTIGRGMRNGCPVKVFFVDASWGINSAKEKVDSESSSMLIKMRVILEECMNNPDPITKEIYQELYQSFLTPLQNIKNIKNSKKFNYNDDNDDFDSYYDEDYEL
jgi:hypothetical protein